MVADLDRLRAQKSPRENEGNPSLLCVTMSGLYLSSWIFECANRNERVMLWIIQHNETKEAVIATTISGLFVMFRCIALLFNHLVC